MPPLPSCELCGKPAPDQKKIVVDQTVFTVCTSCSKRGKPYVSPSAPPASKKRRPAGSAQQQNARARGTRITMSDSTVLSPDFARRIRESREKKGLSVEQLGMQMNEKAAFLRKIESGALKPDESFADKLERFLGIRLYLSSSEMEEDSDD